MRYENKFEVTNAMKDVRVLFMPPMTVAAYKCTSVSPEADSLEIIVDFIEKTSLAIKKPDFRHFGFTHNNDDKNGVAIYERWVTIPNDMTLDEPFQKKPFSGGLYAAHMIPIGYYDEWAKMYEWASRNEQYISDFEALESNGGILEEYLNFQNLYKLGSSEIFKVSQLDLLLKVKAKNYDN